MFQPMKEWVNKVNLSSFELENFFKFVLAWLAREKPNNLTPHSCLHTLMQTLLSSNQSARTILVILEKYIYTAAYIALFWSSRLNILVLLPFPMLNNFGTRLLPRLCLHHRLDPRLLQPASPRKPVEAQALERQGWVQGMPLIIIRCLLATYLIM